MKRSILIALMVIMGYNYFLIQRDQQLFNAYDQACKQQSTNPNCRYSK
jgi:preprotein translocase subunit YajC